MNEGKKNRQEERLKDLVFHNMVLERGLVLAPVVVMGNSLKNAVALSVAFLVITFITVTISTFVPQKIPYAIRVILNVMIASVVFIPIAMWIERLEPGIVYNLGIFLPLLITNSLIVQKSETRFRKQTKPRMMLDLSSCLVGFALVICFVGGLREIVGNATLWGNPLSNFPEAPAVMLPFSGFILIGFLSAMINRIRLHQEGVRSGRR